MARIVIALGGNALQKSGEADAESQKSVVRETARQLIGLIKDGHQLLIVHGNGPQVGAILLQEEMSEAPAALDTCVAMSQGEIGYWLQQALGNELRANGMDTPVATLVTQVVVAADDPAFVEPTKPIGSFYLDEVQALRAAAERRFVVKEDAGRGWRRVVASPRPLDIVEKDIIRSSLAVGSIVIVAGGGGVPVVAKNNEYVGVEAVIDKDFAAAKAAELVDADMLLIVTAVDAVSINFRTPRETNLGSITTTVLEKHIADEQFAPGSMLPKVQAAARFANLRPANRVIITSPSNVTAAVNGRAGTHVRQG